MNIELISNLQTHVEEACQAPTNTFGFGIWTHHIKPMITIGQKLAKDYNADVEIVTIAVLLHDLAAIKDDSKRKEHHIYGAEEARTILMKYDYPTDKIELIQKCILNHRGSVNNPKTTIEEICVADADAIAHIQEISSLFYVAYKELNLEIDEGRDWIKEKIKRDWKKMSDRGKRKFKNKYNEILRVIE